MNHTERKTVGDMKAGITGSKPKLSILPFNGQVYTSRAVEYGADKYARGNYFGPGPKGVSGAERFLAYIDAAARHLGRISQALNIALGTGGDLAAAASIVDDEASGGFPPSMLPHLSHAMASLSIGVEVGIAEGLLPVDPGQPWKAARTAECPQKDDAAAERARVAALSEARKDAEAGPVNDAARAMLAQHRRELPQ